MLQSFAKMNGKYKKLVFYLEVFLYLWRLANQARCLLISLKMLEYMLFQLPILLNHPGEPIAHQTMSLVESILDRASETFLALTLWKILKKETMMKHFSNSSKSSKNLLTKAMFSNGVIYLIILTKLESSSLAQRKPARIISELLGLLGKLGRELARVVLWIAGQWSSNLFLPSIQETVQRKLSEKWLSKWSLWKNTTIYSANFPQNSMLTEATTLSRSISNASEHQSTLLKRNVVNFQITVWAKSNTSPMRARVTRP